MPVHRAGVGTSVSSAEITDATIADADVATNAAIAYSKLNLSNSIVAGDIASNAVGASEVGSLPAVRIYNAAAISVPNNAYTVLAFDTERFDPDGIFTVGSSASRLTVVTAGVYAITAGIRFAANAVGIRVVALRLNGSTYIAQDNRGSLAADVVDFSISTLYKLAATDYVQLVVFQNSGGALDVSREANVSPEFGMAWMGEG